MSFETAFKVNDIVTPRWEGQGLLMKKHYRILEIKSMPMMRGWFVQYRVQLVGRGDRFWVTSGHLFLEKVDA